MVIGEHIFVNTVGLPIGVFNGNGKLELLYIAFT